MQSEITTVASLLRSLADRQPNDAWRAAASALLRSSGRECDGLVPVFEEGDDEHRTLILELLSGAGTPAAQAAMRRILALPSARSDKRAFAAYVQKLARVEAPNVDTLAFLGTVYAEAKAEPQDVRAACSYALGLAIGRANASGDAAGAFRASEALRRDLLASTDTLETCALLTALGHASLPGDVAISYRFAQHADAVVRAAAALSLRKTKKDEVRAQLLTLVADAEPRVAQSALVALADHELSDDDRARLAALVLAGRTAPALDPRILGLLTTKPSARSSRAIDSALRLLLSRAMPAEGSVSGERRIPSEPPPASESSRVTIPTPFPRGQAAPLPYSGKYRMGTMQLERLGLDAAARRSNLPAPPLRNAGGTGTVIAAPIIKAR